MPAPSAAHELLSLTAEIVSAHVSRNPISAADLPVLIQRVHLALAGLEASPQADTSGKPQPAVAIRASVTPGYLVCLEDGKKLKMLKRYLRNAYNLTPDQYRARWGLPRDYPMVAPDYAAKRSSLAKAIGLGTASRQAGKPGRQAALPQP